MRTAWGVLLLLVVAPGVSASEIDISGGSEYFLWQEFSDGGSKLLDESGMRYFVSVWGTNRIDRGWDSDFGGRLYSGTVAYDGQTTAGVPLKTDTDYNGSNFELGFTHYAAGRRNLASGEWLIRFALGTDRWRRSLQDSHDRDGNAVSGSVERYVSNYAKLGAIYRREGRWEAGFGAKAPFFISEEADLEGSTVTLNPEGQLSLYAHLDVPLSNQWSLGVKYDSYRFSKSDKELVYLPSKSAYYRVWQPESSQDTLGVAVHYRF